MENIGSKEPLEPRHSLLDGESVPLNWFELSPKELAELPPHYHCDLTLLGSVEQIDRLRQRAEERELTGDDVAVALISVDDPNGGILADIVMPDQDWNQYRGEGVRPIARGLVMREGLEGFLGEFDQEAAEKLRNAGAGNLSIVVIDYGVAEVYDGDIPYGEPPGIPFSGPPDHP
jgi:hypothetical protein